MGARRARFPLLAVMVLALASCMPFELRDVLEATSRALLVISPSTATMSPGATMTFSATGGAGSCAFSVFSGAGTIDAGTGEYTAPTSPGSAVVRVTDGAGATADASLTISAATLLIIPSRATVPTGADLTFSAEGGTGTYAFSVVSGGGAIDPGTGAYTAPAVAGAATVRLTDSAGATADAALTIQAGGTALAIVPSTATVPAGSSLAFSASGGSSPYVYSRVSGGGTVNATTGEYSAPLSAGSAVVRVTDGRGATADAPITIQELATGLALSPSAISVTVNCDVQFSAVGGTGPYSFAVTVPGSGSPGINGTTGYYVAGGFVGDDTVQVTDSASHTATAVVHVVVAASGIDYTVSSTAGLPASGVAGATIPGGFTFTLHNAGPGGGAASVDWTVYLSSDAALGGGDLVVASGTTGPLASGASAPVTLAGSYPASPLGAGFLIVTVAAADDTTPANNTSAGSAFTLQPRPVDYVVPSVSHTGGTIAGGPVTGTFRLENQDTAGGATSVSWYVYASFDTGVDGTDYLLQYGSQGALAAGAFVDIPISGSWPSSAGAWRLLVKASAADDVDAGNDTGYTAAVTVTGSPPPDVNYAAATPVNSGSLVAGDPMAGSFQLTNTGAAAGSQTVYWVVYRSADATLDVGSDAVAAMGSRAALGAGASLPIVYSGTWPAGAAIWHLFATVSAGDDINTGNNESTGLMVSVTAPQVDYVVQSFTEAGSLVVGDPIAGTLQVRNHGTSAGTQSVGWTVYLSQDVTLDPATDMAVDAGVLAPLASMASSVVVPFDGAWPWTPAPPWTWRLYLVVAAADESDSADNASGALLRTTAAPNADYDIMSVNSTGGTKAGYALAGTFTVKNLGPHNGTQAVPWRVYLSDDDIYDAGIDTLLDSGNIPSPGLASGVTSGAIAFAGSWPSSPDTWYLVAVVGAGDDQNPANDNGPSAATTTTAPVVNYDPQVVSNTGGMVAGGSMAGQFTVRNIGTDNGSRPVGWTAYRSDDATLTIGVDPVIDSGSTGALPALTTSGSIPFTNTWPVATAQKSYYLFVRVQAADDTVASDDVQMSGVVTVDPPQVDYQVNVIDNTGPLVAGGPLSGSMQIQNAGSANGSRTVYWSVYRSLDPFYTAGVDPIIDSGSFGALAAGGSSNPIFAGTWPESGVPTTWYYIVRIVAADDVNAGNDEQPSAGFMVSPPVVFPDYQVVNAVFQPTGTPGAALAGAYSFQVQNAAANAGTKTITWRVYASLDAILDGSDTQLATGSIGPLGPGATSVAIPYGGTWPSFGSYYRLIVSLDADDDSKPSNDTLVTSEVEVPLNYNEGTEIAHDTTYPFSPPSAVSNLGITILPNQLVQITGAMDASSAIDNYIWTAGAGMTRIEMKIKWNTTFDDCDLYFWTSTGTAFQSQDVAAGEEPGGTRYTIYGLTPGNQYYTAAYFYLAGNTSGSTGLPYRLLLYGTP